MTDNEIVCCASFWPHIVHLLGITYKFFATGEGEETRLAGYGEAIMFLSLFELFVGGGIRA